MDRHAVFVSSTQADLAQFRAAMCDVILKLSLEPIMMEYFPGSAASGTIASLVYVDRSAIFSLVLGWRYGLPPVGYTQSVTEMEYHRAFEAYQSRSMPLLVYLADERTREQPNAYFNSASINTLNSDAQSQLLAQKLQGFRDTLQSRHLCKTFTTPTDLALQFSTDISATISGGFVSQRHIRQAEESLKRGDFTSARSEARMALAHLPESAPGGYGSLAARARFLLALGLLGRQPVMTLSDVQFSEISDLLEAATRVQPTRLIYCSFLAAVKQEYAVNGFHHLEREASFVVQQAHRLAKIPADTADRVLISEVNQTLNLPFFDD